VSVDLPLADVLLSVAVGVGLAAAVGLRVFLPMLVLGGAARLGWITLGADFAWIASNVGLTALAIATIAEIAAYQFPVIDNALDTLATPVAIAAGVVAIAAVTNDLPAPLRWSLAVIAGGGTAGLVQSLTTIARLKSTGLTAGLANPFLAVAELTGAAIVAVLSVAAPLLAVALVVALVWTLRRTTRPFARR
jgi:hypothetical protein